jgi:hypothetical protein
VLPATNATVTNSTNYPLIVIDLALGGSLVRADVIPHSATNSSGLATKEVLGVETLGSAWSFPLRYQPRGFLPASWDGRLDDGSFAPAGTYSILVRALKLFGDEGEAEEYEGAETVEFSITYA